jgi:hypothetical protein
MVQNRDSASRVFRIGCLWPLLVVSAIGIQLALLLLYPEWPQRGRGLAPGPFAGVFAGIGQLIVWGLALIIGLVSAVAFVATGAGIGQSKARRLVIALAALITTLNVSVLVSTWSNTVVKKQVAYEKAVHRGYIDREKMEKSARAQKVVDDEFRRGRWAHSVTTDVKLLWDPARSSLWSRSSAGSTVHLQRWESSSDDPVESVAIPGGSVILPAYIRDGFYFTPADRNGQAVIEVHSLSVPEPVEVIPNPNHSYGGMLAVSRDGNMVASLLPGTQVVAGTNLMRTQYELRVWNRRSKSNAWQSPRPVFTHRIALSEDGAMVAAHPPVLPTAPGDAPPGPADRLVIWDTATGNERLSIPIAGTPVSFSPAGDLLAVEVISPNSGTSVLKVLRTLDGTITGSFPVGFDPPRELVMWGTDGNPFWITARSSPEIIVCNLASSRAERILLPYSRNNYTTDLLVTPDRQMLYVAERGAILRFDLMTGMEINAH